ncbi:uncharacterized protein SCHCODRAFT_02637855 [Schizophyllum commune H4-8]|uniref:uncharacterized protein n=1 Tax=Schizophyllum commune (strain H4-8 / FGSC 9210) TaxID=578458 RepID=UPI0021610A9E|nr:uncharacterized protein SCHCODRAFT_02637855 [Schizophyllum commune H4-8]KAI5888834.1 hypothetical protein SCHCODRAFT_02637855 [Schizophyllum commune H4-8]
MTEITDGVITTAGRTGTAIDGCTFRLAMSAPRGRSTSLAHTALLRCRIGEVGRMITTATTDAGAMMTGTTIRGIDATGHLRLDAGTRTGLVLGHHPDATPKRHCHVARPHYLPIALYHPRRTGHNLLANTSLNLLARTDRSHLHETPHHAHLHSYPHPHPSRHPRLPPMARLHLPCHLRLPRRQTPG